jgi:hypothetical protein
VLRDWSVPIITSYIYSLLLGNMIKCRRFIVDTLHIQVSNIWDRPFQWALSSAPATKHGIICAKSGECASSSPSNRWIRQRWSVGSFKVAGESFGLPWFLWGASCCVRIVQWCKQYMFITCLATIVFYIYILYKYIYHSMFRPLWAIIRWVL